MRNPWLQIAFFAPGCGGVASFRNFMATSQLLATKHLTATSRGHHSGVEYRSQWTHSGRVCLVFNHWFSWDQYFEQLEPTHHVRFPEGNSAQHLWLPSYTKPKRSWTREATSWFHHFRTSRKSEYIYIYDRWVYLLKVTAVCSELFSNQWQTAVTSQILMTSYKESWTQLPLVKYKDDCPFALTRLCPGLRS